MGGVSKLDGNPFKGYVFTLFTLIPGEYIFQVQLHIQNLPTLDIPGILKFVSELAIELN